MRAKAKIREDRIPYQVPSPADLPERLDAVLHVIYLVFNEGYSASSGAALTRADLSSEAIRLGRLVNALLPEPEVAGLLALMLLQESRRAARTSPIGELTRRKIRSVALWNREQMRRHGAGGAGADVPPLYPYTLQAAVDAEATPAARRTGENVALALNVLACWNLAVDRAEPGRWQ